ncbi:MAG TPA: phage tail tube protein [Amaricoccus sp.]|uniref:phage tail tube protein n=1 Tax=Amaricoccus sp. TaxID=1872485 RepID=UPI002B8A031A|nr:phage tail tube protein [Amaricoccus sp.]HMR51186.1 phage tail tube protein [Amaricoccus sp.]HMT98066.1 phage tail tube protein [Amaricoccus sp.]
MASKQIISYGATVERSTDGVTYTPIPECKGVAVPEVEQEYPEVTSFDSPNGFREYIKGLKDGGEIEVPCGYTAAGFEQQLADQAAADAIYYRATLKPAPDQSTGDSFTYRGFPTPRLAPGGVGDPIEMTVMIRVTGDFTWTRGS